MTPNLSRPPGEHEERLAQPGLFLSEDKGRNLVQRGEIPRVDRRREA